MATDEKTQGLVYIESGRGTRKKKLKPKLEVKEDQMILSLKEDADEAQHRWLKVWIKKSDFPWATTTEPICWELLKPVHLQPVLCHEKPSHWEACAPQLQSSPHSAMKTQCNKKLINFKN